MRINRRAALTGLAAACVSANAQAQPNRPLGVDMLCYGPASGRAAFEALRAAGDTGIVLDIGIYPRTYEPAKAELQALNALEAEPNAPIRIVKVAADFERARSERRVPVVLASQDASILGTALRELSGASDGVPRTGPSRASAHTQSAQPVRRRVHGAARWRLKSIGGRSGAAHEQTGRDGGSLTLQPANADGCRGALHQAAARLARRRARARADAPQQD